MEIWHLDHAEKAIVRFAIGLSDDASEFEKRNYKKYRTVTGCLSDIEYDIRHGVQKYEIMEIISQVERKKKYVCIRSDLGAMTRLQELKNLLSGISKEEEWLAWHRYAYTEKMKQSN
jgi:hypothetical protein